MCTPEGLVRCKHIIGPYVDAVGLALGRQSVLQVTPNPCPHFKTTIKGGVYVVSHRRCVFWAKCVHVLYNALTLV